MDLLPQAEQLHAGLVGLLDAVHPGAASTAARLEAAWERCHQAWEDLDLSAIERADTELENRTATIEVLDQVARLRAMIGDILGRESEQISEGLERLRGVRQRLAYYSGGAAGESCDVKG